MKEKIEAIIEQDIRPYLKSHHGDMEIISMEKGILKIKVTGTCASCPGLQMTLSERIENQIKEKCSAVKQVVLDQSIDEILIQDALKILRHHK